MHEVIWSWCRNWQRQPRSLRSGIAIGMQDDPLDSAASHFRGSASCDALTHAGKERPTHVCRLHNYHRDWQNEAEGDGEHTDPFGSVWYSASVKRPRNSRPFAILRYFLLSRSMDSFRDLRTLCTGRRVDGFRTGTAPSAKAKAAFSSL
jgi:hypothetical protein